MNRVSVTGGQFRLGLFVGVAVLLCVNALSLWGDDEVSTRLAGWQVIGLEAVDRTTARRQAGRGDHPPVAALGEILPFD